MLRRKLATVELRFGKTDFEKRHYALLALMCIYGIELLDDNVAECRDEPARDLRRLPRPRRGRRVLRAAAAYVLVAEHRPRRRAHHATTSSAEPITFAEWGYLGKGKFQRRDFRFDTLTQMSSFSEEDTLFADLGKHEIFTPTQDLPAADGRGDLAA